MVRNSKTSLITVSSATDISYTQTVNLKVFEKIDKELTNDSEFSNHIHLLKKLSSLKHKEILKETTEELQRKGNWVCIFPSKGCEVYDSLFEQIRPINRFIQKVLFSDELSQNTNECGGQAKPD